MIDEELALVQEELAEARAELERLQVTAADREAQAAHLESELAQARSQAEARDGELASAREQAQALDEQVRASAVRYRELALQQSPELPAELVAGDTVDEVEQSLQRARDRGQGARTPGIGGAGGPGAGGRCT